MPDREHPCPCCEADFGSLRILCQHWIDAHGSTGWKALAHGSELLSNHISIRYDGNFTAWILDTTLDDYLSGWWERALP